MRVLQIISPAMSDQIISNVTILCRSLVQSGDQPLVAGPAGYQGHFDESGLEYQTLLSSRPMYLARELHAMFWKARPDVVQSHSWDTNLPVALAGVLSGVPCIATVHEVQVLTGNRKQRIAYSVLGRLASKVVGVSDAIVRSLVASGVPGRKVIRVYNGVDISKDDNYGSLARGKLGVPDDCRLVGIVMDGQTPMSNIIADIRKLIPGLHVLLFDLEHSSGIETDRQTHVISGTVRVSEVMPSLDMLVFALKTEGIPAIVLEAMASGLPVMAMDSGDVREVIKHSATGYIVRRGRPAELTECIIKALSDSQELRKMGQAGQERVAQYFSSKSMALAYKEIYMQSLGVPVEK